MNRMCRRLSRLTSIRRKWTTTWSQNVTLTQIVVVHFLSMNRTICVGGKDLRVLLSFGGFGFYVIQWQAWGMASLLIPSGYSYGTRRPTCIILLFTRDSSVYA